MTSLSTQPDAVEPRPGRGPGARVSTVAREWLWGWLALTHLVLDLVLAIPALLLVVVLVLGVSLLPAMLVGLPLVALALLLAAGLGTTERLRVMAFTGVAIGPPTPPPADQPAWRRVLLDARPWKAVAYLAVLVVWGLVIGTLTLMLASVSAALALLPVYQHRLPDGELALWWPGQLDADTYGGLLATSGVVGLLILPLVARGLVAADVALARLFLGPSRSEQVHRLSRRVETLTQTRVAAVDSVEAERRRIERDLHDGPQQRLVAIAMDLGMAQRKLAADDPDLPAARDLLDKAHRSAKEAITEMRQVARGIAPPILTDRGLDAALSALAARAPVPVEVSVDLGQRPSPTIEAIAYFCVSEALTNVAKHARARTAQVRVTSADPAHIVVQVQDDGTGGAAVGRGTGLIGLQDRVHAVDGRLDVSSPPGGPTVLTAVLPNQPRSDS